MAPIIATQYENDTNRDRVDDLLMSRVNLALKAQASALAPEQIVAAAQQLEERVRVELIFQQPISQRQIDDFLSGGGQITHVYRAVSHGWNGTLPLRSVPAVAAMFGDDLALLYEPGEAQLLMDEATRTGRVRPAWQPGFAGNTLGYSGTTNITIAIIDSGVDGTHPDLIGRGVYWRDYSTNAHTSPVDYYDHGTQMAGIALGSGAAGGVSGPLLITQNNDLYRDGSPLPAGNFFLTPFHGPPGAANFSAEARWLGGGSTTLGRYSRPNGDGGPLSMDAEVSGLSPLRLGPGTISFNAGRAYTAALRSAGGASVSNYVITIAISNYPAVDSFNRLRGVAPGCNWAGAKVNADQTVAYFSEVGAGLDDLVQNRATHKIKVMNISLGGRNPAFAQKINTAVRNGIVVTKAGGNTGRASAMTDREIESSGRAAMALVLAAANDANRLTDYSSEGSTNAPDVTPGLEQDHKPDLMAPGGSLYQSQLQTVDPNNDDGPGFDDQRPDDYTGVSGVSCATAFAAGCAALVIEALERGGLVWDFNSSDHARLVKMVLCATASESNANRENNMNNPTLQRANPGPSSFPPGKDRFEGYGMINADAAIEAVSLDYEPGTMESALFGNAAADRRVWARRVTLGAGQVFTATLTVPASGDFDLYLYDTAPSAFGTPVILAAGARGGSGLAETINHIAASTGTALLVVKRVSGFGTFGLLGSVAPTITEQPQSLTVNEGEDAVFGVLATGTGPLGYQWHFGGAALLAATDSSYTRTNAHWPDAGEYTVVITNLAGSVTSMVARLSVNRFPVADAGASAALAVAPTGAGADVLLDASRSSDPDADPLQYLWRSLATPLTPIATGIVAVVRLPAGTHDIDLVVNDGRVQDTDSFIVKIPTPSEAINSLAAELGSAEPRTDPLVAALKAALASLRRSEPGVATNQLVAIQTQLQAQISPLNPLLSATLTQAAQEAIDCLAAGPTAPCEPAEGRFTSVERQPDGRVRMQFRGEPGAIHLIEASADLTAWELIGAGVARAEGEFEFHDSRSTQHIKRFYRVRR